MKSNEYRKSNLMVVNMINEIKASKRIDDAEVGKRIGMSGGSIANARSRQEMCKFPFWRVLLIADIAGYKVKFEKKGEA